MSSFAAGKEWLVHTAANMAASMAASRRFLTAAAAQRLDTVLSAGNLWPLGLVFAGWALVRVVGGPIGVAVTSALRLWGAYAVVDSVQDIFGELTDWAKVCSKSTENSQAETEKAAELFAVAVTHGVLDGLELLLVHRIFVSARRVLIRRVPVPAETEAKRKQRADAETEAKQKAETDSKQKQRALAEADAKKAEVKRKLSTVAELAEAAGARRAAESVEGIGSGAVVAVAVAATVLVGVVLVSRSS
ncbi:MAG: hypothetical protein IPN05_09445 [Sulfuritalea sp.]|nr:hypothetical protein [Sulfuritalea sp.]